MSVSPRLMLTLLGATAVLAGCAGEPAKVVDQDAVLRLKLDEYRITPQNIEVQATSVPMRIKIVATNVGRLTHTVKVERLEDENENAPDDEAVPTDPAPTTAIVGDQAGNAAPGEVVRSGERGVRSGEDLMLEPGEYVLADTIGNHQNLGAYGKLTILPPKNSP